jgi:hypothetical protein
VDVVGFYTDSYDEDGRLERNPLEFVRTRELLCARLPPPPAYVLDIGGGTGPHANWLMSAGYATRLIDIVPAHVQRAQAQGLDAHVGDARSLPFEDGAFDATLLLGPLYHLPDPQDRARALAEAARVTRGVRPAPRRLLATAGLRDIEILGIEVWGDSPNRCPVPGERMLSIWTSSTLHGPAIWPPSRPSWATEWTSTPATGETTPPPCTGPRRQVRSTWCAP